MTRKKIGLIVNPVAGIGGRVGLKGSDGLEIQRQALALGAVPLAQDRTAAALDALGSSDAEFDILTAPGEMGEDAARKCGFDPHVLPDKKRDATDAQDTIRSAQAMVKAKVDLLLFAGGDGTARDVYQAIGNDFPVLGIPAGVKIHSAVFAINPLSAGALALAFLQDKRVRTKEAEVVDLDEASYRNGQIVTHLYGYLSVPYRQNRLQNQKAPTPASEAVQAQAIAAEIIAGMLPEQAYVLGPGTTTRAIAERLKLEKTLVGVDIITHDEMLAKDAGEQQILEMLEKRPLRLIVSPTGGQGFLFGRGNQQISPKVLQQIKRDDIQVICLASKISALRGQPLLVDTGDASVDRMLSGYIYVTTGYHEKIIYRIAH